MQSKATLGRPSQSGSKPTAKVAGMTALLRMHRSDVMPHLPIKMAKVWHLVDVSEGPHGRRTIEAEASIAAFSFT